MPDTKQCRECGAPVPRDAPFGNCPGCLVELGFGPPPEMVPQTTSAQFDDYELLERIGRGGMGVVYKARQKSLNRLIALKMLTPHSAAFPRVAERLRLEAETAASLHHPNIVTIHDVGEKDGHPFFTMELIEGEGMDKFIEQTGYRFPGFHHAEQTQARGPQACVVRTLRTIARAVDYAHKHGVLHRDLKPANVVMDAAGEPHLTDFGLAKILGQDRARSTESGSVLGTPAYMSPEQAAGGSKRVSTAADIYSLGAVFYEMLTGHPPFRADTPLETLRRVTEEQPASPTTLNATVEADLATICLKCLEKDPERRYSTALALAEDLERWLRHEPIEARPVGNMERFWSWCRREPRLAGMGAGLILLLTATTILGLTLYVRIGKELAVSEGNIYRNMGALSRRINDVDGSDGRNGVRVYAHELALVAQRPFLVEGNERDVRLGVHLPGQVSEPMKILQRFNPLANCLQTNLAFRADIPLLFELQMYTSYSNATAGLSMDEADLMLVSPASYVRHRSLNKDIYPLAHFASSGQRAVGIALFTHPQSGIHQLSDLKGKSLVFASHELPLFEDPIKSALWTAGLHQRDFSRIEDLPRGLAISEILAERFDAGVATLKEFVRLTNAGFQLHLIQKVSAPGYLWVTTGKSPKLSPATVQAIQDRLLAIRDLDVLNSLDESLTGFVRASTNDFDEVEKSIERARLFDAP